MKKNILFIGVMTLLFTCSIANAARHSTPEEINYALTQSVNSLHKTDNYYSALAKGDYNFFQNQKKICQAEVDFLASLRSSRTAGGQEAATCLANAYLIVMLRNEFLDNVGYYFQAIHAGNKSDSNYYASKCKESYSQAEKWREQFRKNYGY